MTDEAVSSIGASDPDSPSSGFGVGRAGALSLLVNVGMGVFGFLSALIANRLLGPEGRGELAVIQTIPSILATLAIAGLPDATLYLTTRARERGATYLVTAAGMLAVTSLACVALGYVVAPLLLDDKPARVLTSFRFYLLLIPALALCTLATQPLRAMGRFALWNLSRLSISGAWLVVVALAAVRHLPEPGTIARWHVASIAVLALGSLIVAGRVFQGPRRFDRRSAAPLLRFGVPTAIATVPQLLNLRVDQMFMVVLVKERQLGLYAAAVGFSWIVNPPLHALGNLLFPLIAGEADETRRVANFARGCRVGIATTALVGLGAIAVTPVLFPLAFGESFRPAVRVAMVVVGGGALAGCNLLLEEATKGLGRPKRVLWAELAGLAVTATTLLPMIHWFGIMGAAIASVLAYTTTAAVLLGGAARSHGVRLVDLMWIRRADVAEIRSRLPRPLR